MHTNRSLSKNFGLEGCMKLYTVYMLEGMTDNMKTCYESRVALMAVREITLRRWEKSLSKSAGKFCAFYYVFGVKER